MKKSQAQAELLSQPGRPPRASSPLYVQNDTAKLLDDHVPHHLFTCIFFYLFIDYKHKHTAVASELYVVHLLNAIFFYFLIDYKHKHTATGVASHVSHVRFFLFF